jgi:hypothetical protein
MKSDVKIKTGKRLMKNDRIELPVEVTYNYDTELEIDGITHKFVAGEPSTILLSQKLGKNASSKLSEKHMELERLIMDEKWRKQDSYDAKSVRETKKLERERAEQATKDAIAKDRKRKKKLEESETSKEQDSNEGEI